MVLFFSILKHCLSFHSKGSFILQIKGEVFKFTSPLKTTFPSFSLLFFSFWYWELNLRLHSSQAHTLPPNYTFGVCVFVCVNDTHTQSHVWVHVYTCSHVCMHACRSQRSTLDVSQKPSSQIFFPSLGFSLDLAIQPVRLGRLASEPQRSVSAFLENATMPLYVLQLLRIELLV